MLKALRSVDLECVVSWLSSPSLERRLQAVKEMRLCVDWMERVEEYEQTSKSALSYLSSVVSGSDVSAPPPLPVTTPFVTQQALQSPQHLTDWLLGQAVVELAFTASTCHVEVMRRMDRVLRWLAGHRALSDSHLDSLWALTVSEKHESVEHLLYELLGKLASSLSPPQLSLLLQRIAAVPLADYDVQLCQLIKRISSAQQQHLMQQQQQQQGGNGSTQQQPQPAQLTQDQVRLGLSLSCLCLSLVAPDLHCVPVCVSRLPAMMGRRWTGWSCTGACCSCSSRRLRRPRPPLPQQRSRQQPLLSRRRRRIAAQSSTAPQQRQVEHGAQRRQQHASPWHAD